MWGCLPKPLKGQLQDRTDDLFLNYAQISMAQNAFFKVKICVIVWKVICRSRVFLLKWIFHVVMVLFSNTVKEIVVWLAY